MPPQLLLRRCTEEGTIRPAAVVVTGQRVGEVSMGNPLRSLRLRRRSGLPCSSCAAWRKASLLARPSVYKPRPRTPEEVHALALVHPPQTAGAAVRIPLLVARCAGRPP